MDLFEVSLGFPIHKNQIKENFPIMAEGLIPYVTRTTTNNGVEFYVKRKGYSEKQIQKGNVITIGAEGLVAFYQESDFITGNKVNILSNKNLNKYNAIYLSTIINYEIKGKFNYGRAIVQTRLKKLVIKLPTDNSGNPDWQFMEEYIKSLPYSKSLEVQNAL